MVSSGPAHSRHQWSCQEIIEKVRWRHQTGRPLNAQAVARDDSALLAAARRYFGHWNRCLEASGIDPASCRPRRIRRPPGYWTRERIVASIRHYAEQDHPLHAHYMQQTDNALLAAATYHFGSWAEALEAAGLDPQQIRRTTPRSAEQIIEAIQAIAASDRSQLRDSVARRHHRALYGAAQTYFGSWAVAVTQAGISYEDVVGNRPWTKDSMMAVVVEYVAAGFPLEQAFRRHPRLKAAILREWGSLSRFQEALGSVRTHRHTGYGARLRALREHQQISQERLAKLAGVPLQAIQAYESDHCAIPLNVASQIARALNMGLDHLMRQLDPELGSVAQ